MQTNYKEATSIYSKATRNLLELALKGAIVCNAAELVKTVIWFAKKNNYLLSMDEQTAVHVLYATYPGKPLEADYRLMRMLI